MNRLLPKNEINVSAFDKRLESRDTRKTTLAKALHAPVTGLTYQLPAS